MNINWQAPFKFKDYVFGFQYHLSSNLKKLPEKLFVRKTFPTPLSGVGDITAEFSPEDKVVGVVLNWMNEKRGVDLAVAGNSKDKFTVARLGLAKNIKGVNCAINSGYDHLKKQVYVATTAAYKDLTCHMEVDSENKDPRVSLLYNVDSRNTVIPSVSLKTGEMSYSWRRFLDSGSLSAAFHPGKNVELEWRDQGASGVWVSRADVPMENPSKPKFSFSREWSC